MDRNGEPVLNFCLTNVALRKESVDRNDAMQVVIVIMYAVALRKESVDRNPGVLGWSPVGLTSLSARRAWIEIMYAL